MLALTQVQKTCIAQLENRFPYFGLGFLVFFFLMPFTNSLSQSRICDSLPSFQKSIYDRYFDRVGAAAHLYNGAEYEGSYIGILGNPLWNNPGFQVGSISYDDVIYHDVPLAFDVVRNEILTKTLQPAIIRLERSKVQFFCLDHHQFVVTSNDTTTVNPLPDDIYDLAFDRGSIRLLIKRSKEIRHASNAESRDSIVVSDKYFIQYGYRNYQVKNAGDLSKIFYEGKNGFRALWKQKQLNFKKDPEALITQSLEFWIEQTK